MKHTTFGLKDKVPSFWFLNCIHCSMLVAFPHFYYTEFQISTSHRYKYIILYYTLYCIILIYNSIGKYLTGTLLPSCKPLNFLN